MSKNGGINGSWCCEGFNKNEQQQDIHQKKISSLKRIRELQDPIICEYEDPDSPPFGKTATTVHRIITKKFPLLKDHITDKLIKTTLEQNSSTYSRTRKVKKNIFFHRTSFYSTHPHYRWHVDLQDMVIFKKALLHIDKKKMAYSFMLISVDDFSHYIMIELLKDKCASTVHMAMVRQIQREGHIPIIICCDQGSEFKNKLFDGPKANEF